MGDPFIALGRVIMLVLAPVMVLFPLLFALLVPNRAAGEAARLAVRVRLGTLALVTLVLLAVWAGLVVTSLRFAGAMTVANVWWAWFFVLWFFGAWPTVAIKRPDWGANVLGTVWPGGAAAGGGEVRAASLVNRQRRSPVTWWMWSLAAAVAMLGLGALAARGLQPFPLGATAADQPAASATAAAEGAGGNEPWRLAESGKAERSRWVWAMLGYGVLVAATGVMLPWALRRTLTEAEPMDAAGSAELAELYARQRRRRVLGLFWAWGVLLPAYLGAAMALPVWYPNEGSLWALLGATAGALLGVGGAIFGTWVTVERARIAEVRAQLERSARGPWVSGGNEAGGASQASGAV